MFLCLWVCGAGYFSRSAQAEIVLEMGEISASRHRHCFRSVNAEVPFHEGFYLEDGAQFISQTGPQADLGEQGPERGGRPPTGR